MTSSTPAPERPRARPLSRDERRDAIAAATVPLLVEHGVEVTTRQIAEAAGVAEGTLFRAFADKDELVRAAVVQALDPEPLVRAILDVPDAGLGDLVRGLAHLLLEAQRAGMRIFAVAHQVLGDRLHGAGAPDRAAAPDAVGHPRDPRHGMDARREAMSATVAAIQMRLSVHSTELRVPVTTAALVLVSSSFGAAGPARAAGESIDPDEVADLLLYGIARVPSAPSP